MLGEFGMSTSPYRCSTPFSFINLYSLCCWYVTIIVNCFPRWINQSTMRSIYRAVVSISYCTPYINYLTQTHFFRLHFETFAQLGKLKVPYSSFLDRGTTYLQRLTLHYISLFLSSLMRWPQLATFLLPLPFASFYTSLALAFTG